MEFRKALKTLSYGIITIIFLIPLYWMFSTSFKPTAEIWYELTYYPHTFYPANFQKVLSGFWLESVINSIIISLSNVGLCILAGFPAAYAWSRSKFMADKHLFFWLLTNRMAPAASFIVPFFGIYTGLGLWDTIPAVVLSHTLFNLPLAIWILSGFMGGIPKDIDEAALIDGYSLLGYFRKIFVPLMKPGIGVAMFFVWLFSWTEMLLASVLSSSAAKPLTVQLMVTLATMGFGIDWGAAAAAGVISMLPGLVVFYWVRKYILTGFTLGRI